MPTIDALTHDSIFILAQPNSKSNSQTDIFRMTRGKCEFIGRIG